MSLDVPVIVMSQLINRDRGEDAEQEPTLAMIRESGAIANDSDVIILLHRPSNGKQGGQIPPTKFIVAKNRMGDRGSFICRSRLDISRFDEIPKDGDGDFDEAEDDGTDGENTQGSGENAQTEETSSDSVPDAATADNQNIAEFGFGDFADSPDGLYDDHDVTTGVDEESREQLADSIFGDE